MATYAQAAAANLPGVTRPPTRASAPRPTPPSAQRTFPPRENGIRCYASTSVMIEEYVAALATIVPPGTIAHASKLSGKAVFYLTTKKVADAAVVKGMTVRGIHVQLEPIDSVAARIVVSNVPPYIPDKDMLEHVSKLGTIVSPVRALPLGCRDPALKHVLSFRRQVNVLLTPGQHEEGSFVIVYEGIAHRLFYAKDCIKCNLCKQEGHFRRDCPKPTTPRVAEKSGEEGGRAKGAEQQEPPLQQGPRQPTSDPPATQPPTPEVVVPTSPPQATNRKRKNIEETGSQGSNSEEEPLPDLEPEEAVKPPTPGEEAEQLPDVEDVVFAVPDATPSDARAARKKPAKRKKQRASGGEFPQQESVDDEGDIATEIDPSTAVIETHSPPAMQETMTNPIGSALDQEEEVGGESSCTLAKGDDEMGGNEEEGPRPTADPKPVEETPRDHPPEEPEQETSQAVHDTGGEDAAGPCASPAAAALPAEPDAGEIDSDRDDCLSVGSESSQGSTVLDPQTCLVSSEDLCKFLDDTNVRKDRADIAMVRWNDSKALKASVTQADRLLAKQGLQSRGKERARLRYFRNQIIRWENMEERNKQCLCTSPP